MLDGGVETPLDELVRLLDLTPDGDDVWLGDQTAQAVATRHVFGGMVLAQALRAAASTVAPERAVHSLHASFLRAGDAGAPLRLEVARLRDGRRFSHRRVSVRQERGVLCEALIAFAAPWERPVLEHGPQMPRVPAADTLPTDEAMLADHSEVPLLLRTTGPIDQRYVDHPQLARDAGRGLADVEVWMRADGTLPDDPVLHACVAVYASDLGPLEPVGARHALSMRARDLAPTSLDHAVWFHSPVRADAWMLAVLDSPWAGHGRGMGRVAVFQDGVLALEVAQEGLLELP